MAAASANKPGVGARRYRNTGTYGTPTWTAQLYDRDVTIAMPWDMAEGGTRATRAKTFIKTRTDLSVTVVARADDADAAYTSLMDAAFNPTSVMDCLVLNGLISTEGARGVRGEFLVNLDSDPQEIDGSIYDTFMLKPAWTSNAVGPSTVVMGASSTPSFTAL